MFIAVFIFVFYQIGLDPLLKEKSAKGSEIGGRIREVSTHRSENELIRSVRIDLSSVDIPSDFNQYAADIMARLVESGANAVYISPWSDGRANYESLRAPLNDFGKNGFLENFIKEARVRNIKTYAWFVAGKDNFPFFSNPEWFAKTLDGKDYYQADEPGVELPFASLDNRDYLRYHLELINEVNDLPIDGWVISEPVIGWGDAYDSFYTDFSLATIARFKSKTGIDPKILFDENSDLYYENNPSLYAEWINLRAGIVTDFVAASIEEIRKKPNRTVIVTLFTEPDRNGRLTALSGIREWLGTDVPAIAALKPDYFELQALFADFEYPQNPVWAAEMVKQFRAQLPYGPPLLVSVQGFGVAPDDFAAAISSAMKTDVKGVSFYAYHTLSEAHWMALGSIWGE
ncbi:hypothetical protein A2303_01535 [Candidatus Falkowbacteria bacterium RIFOXYB2_FULL_47_14]|nr:MAG: hypothetical protein A2468_03500 [Candidatus Falkowbacteria bacterium RIFOXYC2_FULL_46_15]OGF43467.1 MAG: hypothetical protein A2303_01535 [Candidatus Falkowbacteria bacterium RIFOXYB2_FULL_47_14]